MNLMLFMLYFSIVDVKSSFRHYLNSYDKLKICATCIFLKEILNYQSNTYNYIIKIHKIYLSIQNDKLTKERNEYASEMEKKNNEISKIRKSQNQLQEGYMVFHFVTSVLIFLVLLPNLFENAVIVTLLNSIQIFVNLVLFDSRRERSEVLIDKKSVLYLFGTELTYSDGLNGKGFQWENPNASRTCGCGESFAL